MDTSPITYSKPPEKSWGTVSQERMDALKAAIDKFSKPLSDLVARNANEGDTRFLVTDFLCEGLGYDKYEDLTTEYMVKGDFADYGVKIDNELVSFIEVKRCATKLNEKHLRQVEMYAVNEGVEWMVLTNGQIWQVYHLTASLPIAVDLVLDIDILDSNTTTEQKAEKLFPLAKEAFRRNAMDVVWKSVLATSPKSIEKVIFSTEVLDSMRKELRRQTGHTVDVEELELILRDIMIDF